MIKAQIKIAMNKYKETALPVKAAFWFTICNFLQRGISMITTPIFTRVLPTEEYGLYSTYLSWENVMLMIVSLCLYKALMNLYVKYDNKEKVLSSLVGLEILLTGAWSIIGITFCKPFARLMGISPVLVCSMFVYFIFHSGILCWSLYKRYVYDYRTLAFTTLLITLGTSFLGILAAVFISPTAESRVVSSVLVTAVIGLFIYISVFRKGKTFYDKNVWVFSLGFCAVLMPHYLSEFVLQSSDKIMINYMCGSHDVAMYSIAYSAGSLITLITNAVNSTFAPYQYQKMKAGEYKQLAIRANQVLGFVAVMLCGIMLMSREIVLIFGGEKYLESSDVIIPICLGVFFNYMFQLFARVQEYYERKLTVVIPSILCALLNLILNYIFIKLYGYQAAAYTTFACYLIFCIIHYLFYKKVCLEELQGTRLYDVKGLGVISGLVIVAGVVIAAVNQYIYIKYGILVALLIAAIIKRKKLTALVQNIFMKEK